MSELLRPKSPAQIADERAIVESLIGPELFQIPEGADPTTFVARGQFAAEAIRAERTGRIESYDPTEARMWVGALNRAQAYTAAAEADPDSSYLRPQQIPIMRLQTNFLERDAYRRQGGCVRGPTSIGKTILLSELVFATGLKALVVVPLTELLEQTRDSYQEVSHYHNLHVGVVHGHEKNPGDDINITTYNTLLNTVRAKARGEPTYFDTDAFPLVGYDEVHDLLGRERRKVVHAFPHAVQVGYTATNEFSDEKTVADVLPIKILDMELAEGQTKKLVAPHRNIIVRTPTDMRDVYVASTGEYAQDILYSTINTDERNRVVVDTHLALFPGKKAVIYCAGIKHAQHMAALFRDAGIAVEAIHYKVKARGKGNTRANLITRFKQLEGPDMLDGLTNDSVLSKGFSVDALEVVHMAAPTLSKLQLMQRGGRSTRLWEAMPDKVGYIVQYIDQNYTLPPVIFAEDIASGYAQHGWEGFVFPELDTSRFNVLDVELITDPDAVKSLADEFTLERTRVVDEPPENWISLESIAKARRLPIKRVNAALGRVKSRIDKEREKLEADGQPTDDLMDYKTHNGKFLKKGVDPNRTTYVSPDLKAQMDVLLDEYEVVPSKRWRNDDEIGALYDRTSQWVKTNFTNNWHRKKYPDDDWGKYVPSPEVGRARWYFSPNYLRLMAENNPSIDDYSDHPPDNWTPEAAIIADLGPAGYELARLRAPYSYNSNVLYGRLDWGDDDTEDVYCSPKYVSCIHDVLEPDYRSHDRLVKVADLVPRLSRFGITEADLVAEVEKAIEKDPWLQVWQCGLFWDENRQLVYHANAKMSAHIQENAILAKIEAGTWDQAKAILEAEERLRASLHEGLDQDQEPEPSEEVTVMTPPIQPVSDLQRRLTSAQSVGKLLRSVVKDQTGLS